MANTIAVEADVPLGHVIVSDIQSTEVKGNECFEATLNVTGIGCKIFEEYWYSITLLANVYIYLQLFNIYMDTNIYCMHV